MVVRACGPEATALSIAVACFVLAGAAVGHAQTPPLPPTAQPKSITGFVPTFEIMRTVRAAGFQPLEPPMREGRTYVLRATDYRGILMHVALDARTGAIRDVTRIMGPYGMMPPRDAPQPYGQPTYAPPPAAAPSYGAPQTGYERPGRRIGSEENGVRPPRPDVALPAPDPATAARAAGPPLPRPRPIGAPPISETAAKPADDARATHATRAPAAVPTSKTVPVAPFND